MDQSEKYKVLKDLHMTEGEQAFHLAVFGDHLAKREQYKENEGMEAIYYYLMNKHHWLPSQVKAMSYEDIRFSLSEEMSAWTLPKDAMKAYQGE